MPADQIAPLSKGDQMEDLICESVEISFKNGGGMYLRSVRLGDLEARVMETLSELNDVG